jgi:hypothetical protein
VHLLLNGAVLTTTPVLEGQYDEFEDLLGSDLVFLRTGSRSDVSPNVGRAPLTGDRWTFFHEENEVLVAREGRVVSVEPGYVSTTLVLCPGDSGAPAFDERGEWVGVAASSANADCETPGALFTRVDHLAR